MRPSVLPASSTPMKRFFSHLPAWVDWSACGISRASANSIAMACSAVVIELPNGVFMTTIPRALAAGTSIVSTPIPARPMTLRRGSAADPGSADALGARKAGIHRRRVDLGRATHGQTIVAADDRRQLVGGEAG